MEQLQEIAAQLGIDHTFYYLFGIMTAFYAVMSLVYLKPYQRLLDHRKNKTEGAKKEAQELVGRADEKFATYKERLKEVNTRARDVYRSAEEAAKKEESKILGDASTKAKASLQNTQKELDTQKKAVLETLSTDISSIAGDVATKVLGRPVGGF